MSNNKLPQGWAVSTVGQLAAYVNGRAFKPTEWKDSGNPIIRIQNLNNEKAKYNFSPESHEEKYRVKNGDLLFAWSASLGAHIWHGGDAWLNQHIFNVLPKKCSIKQFVFYLLTKITTELYAKAHGSGMVHVTKGKFESTEIHLPPLNEQHRIVAKIEELFSELDKGIENLKTAREQIKVYRQALLKHAFEGKLTAQWRAERRAAKTVIPAQAGIQQDKNAFCLNPLDSRLRGNDKPLETAAALLARIQTERAQRYQQLLKQWQTTGGSKPKAPKPLPPFTAEELAELPELPEGWLWVKYGDLCSIVRNGISAKPEGESGTPIFRISAVRPLFFDMEDIRFIDNSDGEFDSYRLERGDLVFTRYNGSRHYVGVCAEYRSDEKRLFPDKLVQTRVFSKHISTSYLEKALNSGASRRFVESKIRTTAGQSGVSGDDIKNIPVPLCVADEQIQIVTELESKLSEANQLDQTITTSLQQSEALRQSILKKAFSGQLVAQDANDEPAAALLARIRAERDANKARPKP